METKYRALRILSWVFRILAVLLAVVGVGFGVYFAVTPSVNVDYDASGRIIFNDGPPLTGLGIGFIIAGVIVPLMFYAFGELLQLLISTEDNTARTAHMLARMNRRRGD